MLEGRRFKRGLPVWSAVAGTPTSQPQTPMGDPDAGLPPVIETKHEAALTGLSAGVHYMATLRLP